MKTLLAALCCFFSFSAATAQTYLNATGSPTFNTPSSLEMGFVNLGNGNLHLEVPFKSFPQRGAIPLNVGMVYDSRIWQIVNGAWQPTNVDLTDELGTPLCHIIPLAISSVVIMGDSGCDQNYTNQQTSCTSSRCSVK